jgi:cellulose biosynthesis protein BcsQ
VVTVVGTGPGRAAPPALESALAGPSAHRGDTRQSRVLVVPGGHRPGKPDQLQRDRSRAQLPIAGPGKIVVLGCTVGAGQTMTTLLTGEVLASLRDDKVAVLDLNPGEKSLAERALARPALHQAASLGPSRLRVLGSDELTGSGQGDVAGDPAMPDPLAPARDHAARDHAVPDELAVAGELGTLDELAADARAFELAATRYRLVLADPSTSAMPRLLAIADQLVLVAPASAAAAAAIAMTFEWLEAHGLTDLSEAAIMVMNGVSRRTMPQVEQAERVAVGRCRAIVRVPWDDQIQNTAVRSVDQDPEPGQRAAAFQPPVFHHVTKRPPGQHRAVPPDAGQRWAGLLSPATAAAYTALAGVLVAALAVPSAGQGPAGQYEPHGRASR